MSADGDLREARRQRDTALRERDEAQARLDEAQRIIADLRAELLRRGKGGKHG